MITEKDKDFLMGLRTLMDSKDLWVDFIRDTPSRMILKGTYGQKIHKTFGVTRQGVRWRFQHLFGQMYVRAFETILFIEKVFGTQLRDYAIKISQDHYTLHQETAHHSFQSANTLVPKHDRIH